jgi:hypothetical protein
MLLKKTMPKHRAHHLSATLHGNFPLWERAAARDTLCNSKNQFPLILHNNSATDNPIYWSNTESELEHAVYGIISDIST